MSTNEMEVLRPMFERIIREEVREALKKEERHRITEIFVDPASGQLSCSRVGMFLVTAVLFPGQLGAPGPGLQPGPGMDQLRGLGWHLGRYLRPEFGSESVEEWAERR
jgi:hypothetical protein